MRAKMQANLASPWGFEPHESISETPEKAGTCAGYPSDSAILSRASLSAGIGPDRAESVPVWQQVGNNNGDAR